MKYIQFLFENISEEKKERIIAMLADEGFDGFEEKDSSVKTFMDESKFEQEKFNSLVQMIGVKPIVSVVAEENWNAKWEADFEPVEVLKESGEPFVFLRADFHKPNDRFTYDIVVTPKMSFGTGHHATTYMMIAEMSTIDFRGKSVIDFGTGTGVLAILAEKQGAASVTAVDCDDWSIENAKENFSRNSCTRINLLKGETIPADMQADVVLANINLNIITDNIRRIKASLKEGAAVLFSGIMAADEKNIMDVIENAGLKIENTVRRNGWLALYTVN